MGDERRGKRAARRKRAVRRKRAEGAVSIYFIAATAAFVLLNGLLIDFARVAAFRKQAELAVKSGARSVLSSFDPEVYAGYGLFVRGGDRADALFRETLEGNLEQEGPGVFRFLDVRWESAEVTESRPLASHEVFRRQVLEEMKYKAPIDLTIELASRFRGIDAAMAETKKTADLLERMRQAYERREAALDEVLKRQAEAGSKLVNAMAGYVPDPPADLTGTRPAGDVRDIADAALMYPDYVGKRLEDEARNRALADAVAQWNSRQAQARQEGKPFTEPYPTGGPIHSAAIGAYESGMSRLAASLPDRIRDGADQAAEALAAAREALGEAEEANRQMREMAAGAQNSGDEGDAGQGSGDGGIGKEREQMLRDLRESANDLVLDGAFFGEYAAELDRQSEEAAETADAASKFGRSAAAVSGSTGLEEELRSGAERLQRAGDLYRNRYGASGSVLEDRRGKLGEHRAADEERKRLEKEAETEWSSANSLLQALSAAEGTDEEREAFRELDRLYQKNLAWNKAADEQTAPPRPDRASRGRDEAVAASKDWLDALAVASANWRDSLYFAEYAVSRFSYSDPAEIKAWLSGEAGSATSPDKQQAEYILYGLTHPSGNIAAAYGEIFMFRLAIRTMEGLIESRSLGSPLLVLAGALLYAVKHAVADLRHLLDQGKIELSKYVKADTVYSDYLRLFFLLHGGSSGQTARTIAVIEHNTGISLQEAYTYVSGEGVASLRLWFFPGLIKALGKTGRLGGEVAGNRYEAVFTADNAYQ